MEKQIGEDEIKGLEEEIDLAVDRLFVEKKGGPTESFMTESPKPEPSDDSSYGMIQDVGAKSVFQPSSTSSPVLKSIDKMEAQLLSLEWEITKANIEKTKEEVLALREDVEGETETIRVLNLMEKVLIGMLNNEKNIDPPLIKFLLDSKETIKLLMNKETDQEINIYKQLAYTGIEARFDGLEGLKETKSLPLRLTLSDETEGKEISLIGEKKIDQMVDQWDRFSEKLDDLSIKMDQHLSKLNQIVEITAERPIETKPASAHITVIKVDEKLFGVESEKVVKLFKVPDTFCDQYAHLQKIRLKEFEVKVVDLNKIFSIQGGERKRETKILTVKENGEYKGLMVDGVLKKLSTQQDLIRGEEEYFLGMIHSIYQEQRVEIPILDLKKF